MVEVLVLNVFGITIGIRFFELCDCRFLGHVVIPCRDPVFIGAQEGTIFGILTHQATALGNPFKEVLFHNINSEIPFLVS
jgi:hypothetical protein